MEYPSIYLDNTSSAAKRRNNHSYTPSKRVPVDVSTRFTPWDGTLPSSIQTYTAPDFSQIKHWLHKSSHRPILHNPFSELYEPPQVHEYPHKFPPPLPSNPTAGSYKTLYPPDAAFNPEIGTIVIPRHHKDTDFLLLISTTNNPTVPPTGPSSLLARFLVCYRILVSQIPALRGQLSHQSGFPDAQTILLPDSTPRTFPLFLLQLPQVSLDAIFTIFTILHSRFPTSWASKNIPLSTLHEIAQAVFILELQGTPTLLKIRTTLLPTLTRHANINTPPSNHPNIAKWLFIAKTFAIEPHFSSLWANLTVSTWRFTKDSIAVDRYLPQTSLSSSPSQEENYKHGNYYYISDLQPALTKALEISRTRFLHDILHHWSWFRSKYHLPPHQSATFSTILSATATIDTSALELKDQIFAYADKFLEYQRFLSLLSPGKELNPTVMNDIQTLKDDITACFEQVESRDVFGDKTIVGIESYLPVPTSPQQQEEEILETPLELDPISGLYPGIFTFQTSPDSNLIYYLHNPPPKRQTILFGKPATPMKVLILLAVIYLELCCTFLNISFATGFEARITFYSLIFSIVRSKPLLKEYITTFSRLQRINNQKSLENYELEKKSQIFNWMDSMDPNNSQERVELRPRGTDAKIGSSWRKYTPLEGYQEKETEENLFLMARRKVIIDQFRAERLRRWYKEGKDRYGRLPGDEGFGSDKPGTAGGDEEEERRGVWATRLNILEIGKGLQSTSKTY
ncbi:hypothetical protein TWF281_003807 [Arthrobotrys megalospora]